MKSIFALCIVLLVLSCSVQDESSNNYYEILPIENVEMPEQFEFNQTYTINVTYRRPTNCHSYYDIYYKKDGNKRIVAIISLVFADNSPCEPIESSIIETSFDFIALQKEPYLFRFWQGENENGEDQYLDIEVPVIE